MELQAFLGQSLNNLEWIEVEAKDLMQGNSDLLELRKYLRRIPWHLLKEVSPKFRAVASASSTDGTKPAAYVMFGAFSHGGVVGVYSGY